MGFSSQQWCHHFPIQHNILVPRILQNLVNSNGEKACEVCLQVHVAVNWRGKSLTRGSQGNLLFYEKCFGILNVSPEAQVYIGEIWSASCQLDLLASVYIYGLSHQFSWSSQKGPNVGCSM